MTAHPSPDGYITIGNDPERIPIYNLSYTAPYTAPPRPKNMTAEIPDQVTLATIPLPTTPTMTPAGAERASELEEVEKLLREFAAATDFNLADLRSMIAEQFSTNPILLTASQARAGLDAIQRMISAGAVMHAKAAKDISRAALRRGLADTRKRMTPTQAKKRSKQDRERAAEFLRKYRKSN